MVKTKELILKVLGENPGLESGVISNNIDLTYNTTSRHLKQMTEAGILTRVARGNPGKPWNYYYFVVEGHSN